MSAGSAAAAAAAAAWPATGVCLRTPQRLAARDTPCAQRGAAGATGAEPGGAARPVPVSAPSYWFPSVAFGFYSIVLPRESKLALGKRKSRREEKAKQRMERGKKGRKPQNRLC
ncbi:uncharacterized protein LOC143676883 [Tamandua tetradactyla]|uniref:uncharacterized protein LOC143676883 n=1 Tax=Tamandua tetradactyla TaxID=48850 RepID=UPI0040538F8F